MAAKSDGAAVSVQNVNPSRSQPIPEHHQPQYRHAGKRYSLLDCCWVLCAMLVFFSDGATDLWLAVDYYLKRDYWWFGLTLVFVVVPSVVVQVLSFRWFVYDYSDSNSSSGAAAAAAAAAGGDFNFLTKGSVKRGAGSTAGARAVPTAASSSRSGTQTCCRVCMWLFQSIIHILQLGQVWR
ncbi:UNVERIFIED_CONTAM: hypothetical protein FKN15_045980 [Acipenser sinensis]